MADGNFAGSGCATPTSPKTPPSLSQVKRQRSGSPTEAGSSSSDSSHSLNAMEETDQKPIPQIAQNQDADFRAPRVETKAVGRVRSFLGFLERKGYAMDWVNQLPELDPRHINAVLCSHTFETALQAAMIYKEVSKKWHGEIVILVDEAVAAALRPLNLPTDAITPQNIIKHATNRTLMIAFLGGIEGANSVSTPPQEWLLREDHPSRLSGTIRPSSDRTGLPMILTIAARALGQPANIVIQASGNWKKSLVSDGVLPRFFPKTHEKTIDAWVHNPAKLPLPSVHAYLDRTGAPVVFGLVGAIRPWVYSVLSYLTSLDSVTKTLLTLIACLPVFPLRTRGPSELSAPMQIEPQRLDARFQLLAQTYMHADSSKYADRIWVEQDKSQQIIKVHFKTDETHSECYPVHKGAQPELYKKLNGLLSEAGPNGTLPKQVLKKIAFNLMKAQADPTELTKKIQAKTNSGLSSTYDPGKQHPSHKIDERISLILYYLQVVYYLYTSGHDLRSRL